MSVQVHAELVQALAGNAVVAKTPTQGGFHCLTLAHAFMARAGLPVTLLSGAGSKLGDVLISSPGIGALAFVGGRSNGRAAATSLADRRRRHFLEQEGLNAWGVWDFTQWPLLAQHIRKGFEYAKQRCTAYPRFVVQRRLLPAFLETYLPVLHDLRFGHPLAVAAAGRPAARAGLRPGDLARARPASSPTRSTRRSPAAALPLYRGSLGDGRFLPGQDTSAYVAPASVLEPPTQWSLHHAEPFGPLDSVVCVDTEAEFIAAMNASNGCLVASIATDDPDVRRAGGGAAAGVQGRDQQAAQPRRPRGGLRRDRRVVEGRVRRRRPAGAGGHLRRRRRRRAPVRQLPELLALPGPLERELDLGAVGGGRPDRRRATSSRSTSTRAGTGPGCWPALNTQVGPIRSTQPPPGTNGAWWTCPVSTRSGA